MTSIQKDPQKPNSSAPAPAAAQQGRPTGQTPTSNPLHESPHYEAVRAAADVRAASQAKRPTPAADPAWDRLGSSIDAWAAKLRAGAAATDERPSEQARKEELAFSAARERAERARPVSQWPSRPAGEHFRLSSVRFQEPWMRSSSARLTAELALRCPHCAGDGWAFARDPRTDYRFSAPCVCRPWVRAAENLSRSGLPASAVRHRLDDLVWDDLGGHLTLHQGARPMCSEVLVEELDRVTERGERAQGRKGLLLWGSTGIGKSHIVQGLLMHLIINSGLKGRWLHWPTWFSRLKAAMDRNNSYTETTGEVIGLLTDAPVIVLEEIGGEKISDYSRSKLDEALTIIEDNPQSTLLVTTNFSSADLEGQIGARSVSRLMGLCEVMEVRGNDWRRRALR